MWTVSTPSRTKLEIHLHFPHPTCTREESLYYLFLLSWFYTTLAISIQIAITLVKAAPLILLIRSSAEVVLFCRALSLMRHGQLQNYRRLSIKLYKQETTWESKGRASPRYQDTQNGRGSYMELLTHLCL